MLHKDEIERLTKLHRGTKPLISYAGRGLLILLIVAFNMIMWPAVGSVYDFNGFAGVMFGFILICANVTWISTLIGE